VVHVVQDFEVHVPRKYHKPKANAVAIGLSRCAQWQGFPAGTDEPAGQLLQPNRIAKVRVAGSSPVVRSRALPAKAVQGPGKDPSRVI
jgi:hypothetical protein